MKGAIIGDIVGSIYEFNNIKTKDFPLFSKDMFFTDDTVLTCAVADSLLTSLKRGHLAGLSDPMFGIKCSKSIVTLMRDKFLDYGLKYEGAGYGGHFISWMKDKDHEPYNSCGNGSAMRVSPAGLLARDQMEAANLAVLSAMPTHNHPDGLLGAITVAMCINAAKTDNDKKIGVRKIIQQAYPYNFLLNEIRDDYYFGHFQALNAGTVPYAVAAFLESNSFEDAIRNAISIGGDSDTLAAITGSIAEAYYGVPEALWETAKTYLTDDLISVVDRFYELLGGVS